MFGDVQNSKLASSLGRQSIGSESKSKPAEALRTPTAKHRNPLIKRRSSGKPGRLRRPVADPAMSGLSVGAGIPLTKQVKKQINLFVILRRNVVDIPLIIRLGKKPHIRMDEFFVVQSFH